jgi:hypothetical protein
MPERQLHRLIYRSTNAITGNSDHVAAEVEAILAASRRRNEAAGLTGVLVHSAETFTQVIEGELPAVEAVFDRIAMDLRHTDFDLVQFIPVNARRFAAWRMAYVGQGALDRLWTPNMPDPAALAKDPEKAVGEIAAALARD